LKARLAFDLCINRRFDEQAGFVFCFKLNLFSNFREFASVPFVQMFYFGRTAGVFIHFCVLTEEKTRRMTLV
jgi:hypothetical protein